MYLEDVKKARKRIGKYIKKTPLFFSEKYSRLVDGKVFLKLENHQLTHSFKARGAVNKMVMLSEKEKKKGVITASAGNHAQGVALASKKLGIEAIIIIPEDAPDVKINAIKHYGIDPILHGSTFDETEDFALSKAKETGMIYVSPYNDKKIIEGNGTIALEILEEKDDINVFVVPVGGGGLISGISHVVKETNPKATIIGVQSEAAPAMYESIKQGKIVEVDLKESVADGIHGNIDRKSVTFDIVKKNVDEILLVNEEEIKESIKEYYLEYKEAIEGAAAVGLAALKRYKERFKGKRTAVILSGANIDKEDLDKILQDD